VEYLYERFLQHVLCLFTIARVPPAQAHQPGLKKVIEDALCLRILLMTPRQQILILLHSARITG
jgi:hypothetical protein